ncbi:LPXTG cell wall anchor domain-containing protein [Gemella haemolysans]|uniref:LPXTG cell wall anchor domain-containing protein n=1 Tax=Gemella haemolysans TaxID=1379 RepID=UPI001A44355B|nr:LPXTG cell wall anchor domain-containing protein [Gemella haemolysans]VTX83143.1 IgA FC receptor [Gemella haemolysans]
MNKNTKRVLSVITTASLAGVLGGVAPAVAPSALNLNGGVVHAAEKTHKVTIHYDFYDDPMSPFSSSSSSKVVDVTPNQPLSDHIPETFPGGYVFAGAVVNRGGSEGTSLNSRNDLFGDWTNFYVTYPRRSNGSRTNPSNAGTNNNEKPHKVTIHYSLSNGYHPVESPSSEVFYVTPNQPLSDHIPETLPGGYVFTGASAFVEGSEGVTLSSRNDLFGNETTFYARYFPKSNGSRTNPSNAGTNNNASTEVKPNNGNTNSGNNNSNVATPESKISPSDNIINNIFSNDAFGVKVTLTDKTTATKLSATPVEDKALASSVLEKLNLPADNQIRILDLKLLDKDNHVVNSNAKRTVAIVLKEDEKDVAVYHIKDNGELKLIDSTTKDGVVTFEIDHFSKFAIVSNKSKQTSSNINNSKSGEHLAKTGLSNNNLASLAAIGLVLSGVLILGRRKNRK